MPESSLNETETLNFSENEIYSRLKTPSGFPLFIRLDGWRFQALVERVGAEKPFDERLARCLVASSKAIIKNFSPTLVYVISDEINVLFYGEFPFKGRVEKMNSVLSGVVSAAFSLSLERFFGEKTAAAFDCRVIIVSNNEIDGYLTWRQLNGWRNHNNAYAYWLLRKLGYSLPEVAKRLNGLKTKELHELLFRHGINLAETPLWQRRGILVYKETYQKTVKNQTVTRRKITENWKLPLFTTSEGKNLIQNIIRQNS